MRPTFWARGGAPQGQGPDSSHKAVSEPVPHPSAGPGEGDDAGKLLESCADGDERGPPAGSASMEGGGGRRR